MIEKVLAEVPEFLAGKVADGTAERIGMIIRDTATKKIMGHLQEVAPMQSMVSRFLEGSASLASSTLPSPASFASVIGIVQNEQIKGKLDVVQQVLGSVQTLQVFTLASSVAGLGREYHGPAQADETYREFVGGSFG